MKTKVGLLKVLTEKNNEYAVHKNLIEDHFPDLEIVSRCIEDQPEGIYNEETEKIAVPKILELGINMEKEDLDALIVDCAADPGVKELRKLVKIPVIGAGSSCASLALAYGSKIGTLGIRPDAPKIMKEILGIHLIASVKADGVKTSLDLRTKEGWNNSLHAVKILRAKGVEVIAIACTGYSAPGAAQKLENTAGIPVIDALVAAGLFTWFYTVGKIQ
jgi:Asp/Glu/hydantoin racemase